MTTAEMPEIPEIREPKPAAMRNMLQTEAAQAVQAQIEQEVSTKPAEAVTVKRPPGRPPGSRNKPKTETPSLKPPPAPTKSEAEKIAAKALADEKSRLKDKATPPDFTEWQDFLGEVVLHWFSVAFIAIAFRGVPYHDMLSDEDFEDIQLDEDELGAIARPFAHVLTHTKLNGKYGRAIMNSRDTIEAAVVMFMWGARVRRISGKYRKAYSEYLEATNNGITRIEPRLDRPADTGEAIAASPEFPPIGTQRAAFGHGFN